MKQKELVLKVCEWADDKGITEHGTIPKQLLKTHEELHELYLALEDFESEKIIDAVGDVLVTLIVVKYLELKDKEKVVEILGSLRIPTAPTLVINNMSIVAKTTIPFWADLVEYYYHSGEINTSDLTQLIFNVSRVGLCVGSNGVECLEFAYNVIKDRKGKMRNGEFEKE